MNFIFGIYTCSPPAQRSIVGRRADATNTVWTGGFDDKNHAVIGRFGRTVDPGSERGARARAAGAQLRFGVRQRYQRSQLHPHRAFQVAHDNTIASGEITVLDAGSYGSVTITKNISIINDGVGEAGALVSGGGVGITVNAGAKDRVSLRGLTIKGLDPAFGNSATVMGSNSTAAPL